MAACSLTIELDEPSKVYVDGESVSGTVVVTVEKECNCKSLNVVSRWTTHGRGNVDSGEVDEMDAFRGAWQPGQVYRYPFQLKSGTWPPSYYGNYLNVSHQIRARAKLAWARDPEGIAEFQVAATQSPIDLAPKRKPTSPLVKLILAPIVVVLLGFVLIAAPFIIAVLAIVGGLIWFFTSFLPRSITGKVHNQIDSQKLKAGETLHTSLRFTPKRKSNINGVRCTVKCEEKCVSGSGSNAKTHTHVVLEHTQTLLEACTLLPGQEQSFDFSFQLPETAAPSMRLACNDLKWTCETRIDIPRWPDWKETTELIVLSSPVTATKLVESRRAISQSKSWLEEVLEQLEQSQESSERAQLVLEAVREHIFDVQLDVKVEPDGLPQDPAMILLGELPRGEWCWAFHDDYELAFYLCFTDQSPAAGRGDGWIGQIRIIGLLPNEDAVLALAL